jgi:hypothetical protein
MGAPAAEWAVCKCGHRVLGVLVVGPSTKVVKFQCQRCPRGWERPVRRSWRIW